MAFASVWKAIRQLLVQELLGADLSINQSIKNSQLPNDMTAVD